MVIGMFDIGVIRMLAMGLLQMLAAVDANLSVFIFSSKSEAEGERQTISKVNALPPSESCR